MNALRCLCKEHGIFRPTFPAKQMDLAQLEWATTSPARFLARLKRDLDQGEIVKPVCTRIVTNLPAKSEFQDIMLVPGGRFLFTRSSVNVIELWDLGFTSNSFISPAPIASLHCNVPTGLLRLQPSADGNCVVVITRVNPDTRSVGGTFARLQCKLSLFSVQVALRHMKWILWLLIPRFG